MPTSAMLVTFAAATLAMLLVPGPSVLFVVTRSVQDGRAAGMLSVLGLETGAAIHAVATAAGFGAVLASTPWALSVVRYGGAAYLVFLGLRQGFSRPSQAATAAPAVSRLRVFTDGILVDLLNPFAFQLEAPSPRHRGPLSRPGWARRRRLIHPQLIEEYT